MTKRLRYRSNLLNGALLVGLVSASLCGMILLSHSIRTSDGVFVAILANALIQTCVQMRLDLLQHEAAHYKLMSSRKINDFLGNVVCSLPMLSSLNSYRAFHFAHHRHLGDLSSDPEVRYYGMQQYHYKPMSPVQFAGTFMLDLSGFHFMQFSFRSMIDDINEEGYGPTLKIFGWHGIVAYFVGFEIYAVGWLLPMMTIKFTLSKIQGYSEHIIYQRPTAASGHTVSASPFLRFILFPLNSHLHVVHHLEPHVPWALLPERRHHYKCWPTINGLSGEGGLLKTLVGRHEFVNASGGSLSGKQRS